MASSFMTVMVALVFFSSTTTLTKAQDSSTSCATKLVPCTDFLATTTTPPTSCCNPIKEAVANELPCLCKIYNDPVLLPGIGINVTQALLLSKRCGVTSDLSSCNASAPTPAGTPPVDEDDEKQEFLERMKMVVVGWHGLGFQDCSHYWLLLSYIKQSKSLIYNHQDGVARVNKFVSIV